MPKITIDGQELAFEGSHMLLQFAMDQGIEIPYFCYHPAMSIPTNCRMCLVDVGHHMKDRETGEWQFDEKGEPVVRWGRKPATACNTPLADGMIVKTNRTSEEIDTAQKGVLEYMLVNHPLDCPICDQAGECPLQIWTYKYGPEGSRFENLKTHKRKRVDLGPRVILDEERCINCTRCTRFTEEISGSNQLTIIGRGDRNFPGCAPGDSFDDPYSMNTIDICPVGALTSKQHRFQARVWEMSHAPSIDMNDSTGTNTFVWIRDNKVMRITPRKNLDINDYWMPDAHRLNIDFYNENRASGVKIKGGIPINFEEGLSKVATLVNNINSTVSHVKSVYFLGSAYASLESNFALKQLASQYGVNTVYYIPHVEKGTGDNWLIQDDRTPNAAACDMLGFKALEVEDLKAAITSGKVEFLYSLENDHAFSQFGKELDTITSVIHSYKDLPAYEYASIQLPAANSIESEGTYINHKGIPQVTQMAVQIKQMSPDMWMRLPKGRLDKTGVAVDNWRNLDHINDALPSWLLLSKISGYTGEATLGYGDHKDIFGRLQSEFAQLAELKVAYRPAKNSFKSTQLEFANQWGSR